MPNTTTRTVTRRTTRPRGASVIFGKITQHLVCKAESEALKTRYEKLRDEIMTYLDKHGEVDEKGHKTLALPTPVLVAGKEFGSVKRERRVSTSFDEEAAEALLTPKGLLSRVQRTIVTINSTMAIESSFGVGEDGHTVRLFTGESSPGAVVDVPEAIVSWVTVMDQNEVYVLNQQGLITDEELDSLFVVNETWAYKPLTV